MSSQESTQHIKPNTQHSPQLRFAGFAGGWSVSSLATNYDILAGYAFKSSQMTSNASSKFQLIKMSNIYKGVLNLKKNASYWANLDPKLNKFILEPDDILITLTGTVNKRDYGYSLKIMTGDSYLLNQRLARFKGKVNTSSGSFSHYLLKTDRFYYYFFSSSKGGTGNQSNVSIEDLKEIELPLPTFHEQEKIAAFLTSVDDRIEQLKRKKSLLQKYKKGVMQRLFSQQLRFKNPNNNPYQDWEEKEFGYLVNKSSQKHDPAKSNKDFPCIELESLSQQTGQLLEVLRSSNLKSIKTKFSKGQVLFGKLRPHLKKFLYADFDGVCSSEIWVFDGVDISNKFLFHLMQTHKYNQAANVSSGSKMPRTDWDYLSSIPFSVPSSIDEQTKIANYLSSLDNKTLQVTQQITQIQTFKKGLLQQMFV